MKKINGKYFAGILSFFLVIVLLGTILVVHENNSAMVPNSAGQGTDSSNKPDEDLSLVDTLETNNKELIDFTDAYWKAKLEEKMNKDVILAVLGTDERASENSRSDVIMLVKIEPSNQKIKFVSVPRDTKVQIPGVKSDKINHAYAIGGLDLSVKTLEELFDVKVDYSIKLSFESFEKIIDDFGGVKINALKDFGYDGDIIVHKGESVLNGMQALVYVRYRHDSDGDFGRIKRQQEVFKALIEKIRESDEKQALVLLYKAFSESIITNLTNDDVASYYKLFNSFNNLNYEMDTLKTESSMIDQVWYEIYNEEDLASLKDKLRN